MAAGSPRPSRRAAEFGRIAAAGLYGTSTLALKRTAGHGAVASRSRATSPRAAARSIRRRSWLGCHGCENRRVSGGKRRTWAWAQGRGAYGAVGALVLTGAAHAAAPRVTLTAPTHMPKVQVQWKYAVRATVAGKPAAGRITVQIVDPVGGVHAVAYGDTTRKIVDRPFRGAFRDFVRWPAESRGIPLRLKATMVFPKGRKTVLWYRVTPRRCPAGRSSRPTASRSPSTAAACAPS